MATNSFTLELTSPIPPAKFFKANVLEGHKHGPLAYPDIISSAAIIQGDGGVGSIRQINFTNAGSMTERFEVLDRENFEVKLALVEGAGLGDKLEWGTRHLKVEPTADGGSLFKICYEYKTLGGVQYGHKAFGGNKKDMIGMFKTLEAYLLANPDRL